MDYYKGVCGRMHKLIEGCPACDDIEAEKRINKMKDDSLDDTGTRKPDAIKALAQSKTDINKLGRVDIDRINSVYHKEVWNAAIEAAALIADDNDTFTAVEIRKLKK